LKRLGYRYVLVDSNHVEPVTRMPWEEVRYRPHLARYGEDEIVVVIRDRELSYAQESGMDTGWFANEVHERTKHCHFPPLVTTCTDGDNGGWFRNLNNKANFWGVFYQPLLELVKRQQTEIRPTSINDYLNEHGAHGYVTVREGAWNTGWHHGTGFVQWTGSQAQKDALQRVSDVSRAVNEVRSRSGAAPSNALLLQQVEQAYWRVLRAETSCNFFWGEAWVQRCNEDLSDAWNILERAKSSL